MSDAQILNPNLEISPIARDGAISAFEVVAVVKGRGRLRNLVRAGDHGAPAFAALRRMLDGEHGEITGAAWQELRRLGIVVTPAEVASPARFACRLDEIREAELPARSCLPQPAAPRINPWLRVVRFDDLVAVDPRLGEVWEPAERLVVVTDPRTRIAYPYWPGDESRALIERLHPGAPAPAELGPDLARRLFLAGILIDDSAERLDELAAAARNHYAARGYVVLPRLLRAPHLVALRDYYRRAIAEGFMHARDAQVALRFARHSEPLTSYYHVQLQRLFEAITDEPIKCSYPYFAAYRHGAVLDKHVDREQCDLTASLLIDQLPRPDHLSDWPLYLELPATGEEVAIHLGLGDGCLYNGRELPHHRLPFGGELTTCHFYHYVKADFTGPLR